MGVSAPGSGLSEFSKIVYVDDQLIWIYHSDTGKTVPVAPWIKNMNPQYWERETNIAKGHEALLRYEVKMAMNRLNLTEGFHFVQAMQSCELRDDGSTMGYMQYRYDGREYMYYDAQTATYIPTMSEAQITTQRWNSPDVKMGERARNYLENIFAENLKKYIEYGREDLERKVRPGVKVTGRESGGVTKLHCLVYGFLPQAVDAKWMKNGVDEVPMYETTHVLPNPDGTYQIRVTVEVIPQEGDRYFCYVDHSSLEEPLLVRWEPKQDFTPSMVISVGVIGVLVLASVIAGVIVYKSKCQEQRARHSLPTEMSSSADKAQD
ncbi:Belongs to the MHC class I family, partial [Pristimantis euphronides]